MMAQNLLGMLYLFVAAQVPEANREFIAAVDAYSANVQTFKEFKCRFSIGTGNITGSPVSCSY